MSAPENELINLENNDSEVVELREIEQEKELIDLENKDSEVVELREIEVICLSSGDSDSTHNERNHTLNLNKSRKKYRSSSSNSSLNANSLRKFLRKERRFEKTCWEETIARYKESYRDKIISTRFHDPTKESMDEFALDYHYRGHFNSGNFRGDNYDPGRNNNRWDSYGYNDEDQRPRCHDTWVSWSSLYERGCGYDWGRDQRSREQHQDMSYDRDEEGWDRERERIISCERGWCEKTPNNTLILQGLDATLTENEIRKEILHYGLEPKVIRLMRKKGTGASRGFAFVEFQLLSEAVRWKELTKGVVVFRGSNRASLEYSISNDLLGADGCILDKADWDCPKCGMSNLKSRDYCFQYNCAREESFKWKQGDCYNEISNNSSNITVSYAERSLASQNRLTLPPTERRHDTFSVSLPVDGESSFASANAAIVAFDAAQRTKQKQDDSYNQYYGVTAAYSGTSSALDNTQYLTMGSSVLNQAQMVSLRTVIVGGTTCYKYPLPDISTYQYDGSSGYYYDSATGLYYDPNSQYYYNSQSQSYLYWDGEHQTYLPVSSNSFSQQLAIWHPPTSAHQANSDDAAATESETPQKSKKEEKLDKVKIAKKIAKDMEKWAKTLNRKKKLGVVACPPVGVVPNVSKNNDTARPSAAANAGFVALEKRATLDERNALLAKLVAERNALMAELDTKLNVTATQTTLVSYDDNSDTDTEPDSEQPDVKGTQSSKVDESQFIDLSKMACLLCKRQFQNKDALTRHQQLSDMHNKNLAQIFGNR